MTMEPHEQTPPPAERRDWLLTADRAVMLMIFVFASAAGIFVFQTFAIAGYLRIGGR